MASPLFVFSSGRCGSTLFQQLLNATGECAICGEHGGILSDLAALFFRAKETQHIREKIFAGGSFLAWENLFDEDDFDDALRGLVERLFKTGGKRFWGFKEISYGYGERVPEFLSQVLPGARFVILTRDPVATIASQMKAWGIKNMPVEERAERWIRQTSNLVAFARDSDCQILKYEDFTDPDSPALAELFAALGLPMTDKVRELQKTRVYGQQYEISDILSEADTERILSATAELRGKLGY